MSRKPKSKRALSGKGLGNQTNLRGRNVFLDCLRGLAIVLMLTDHAAEYWFGEEIATSGVRFWTRLSLPLFSVLMGYLLAAQSRWNWRRSGQILLASLAVNVIYWPIHHELEILASLLITSLIATAFSHAGPFSKAAAPLLMLSLWAYPIDPIAPWFDYQLTLVGCLVGQGMVLRQFGFAPAVVTGCVLTWLGFAGNLISPQDTHHLIFFFLLPATFLVHLAVRFGPGNGRPSAANSNDTDRIGNPPATDAEQSERGAQNSPSNAANGPSSNSPGLPRLLLLAGQTWIDGMAWIGQFPLIIYVLHYYLIVGLGRFVLQPQ